MNALPRPRPPLVYSCSGASSAAQMANHLAVRLDRLGAAEMSCLAGVGGDVPALVRTARSGRRILALDGCPLHCAARILARHDLRADRHYDLSQLGVPKIHHADFDPSQAADILAGILADTALTAAEATDPATAPSGEPGESASLEAGPISANVAAPSRLSPSDDESRT